MTLLFSRLRHRSIVSTLLAGLMLSASTTLADTVVWRNADGRPGSEFKDVRILRVDQGSLVYLSGGNERTREIDRIYKINVTDDPALNDAETAFIESKFSLAVDGYQRVIRSQQEWKRKYALPRLIAAAQQSGRFDAGVTAYLILLRTEGQQASGAKPQIATNTGAGMLEAAAKEIDQTLTQLSATDLLRQPLLSLLLDIHRARNDAPAIAKTLEQLVQLVGTDAGSNPEMQGMLAAVRLDQAQVAFDQKNFAQVKKLLDEVGPLLSEPQQQIRALDLLARSAESQAGNDSVKLKDAALAYLRIVAHFTTEEEREPRDLALLAAATCLDKAGDFESAKTLLTQILTQAPESSQAVAARTKLAEVEKKIAAAAVAK